MLYKDTANPLSHHVTASSYRPSSTQALAPKIMVVLTESNTLLWHTCQPYRIGNRDHPLTPVLG